MNDLLLKALHCQNESRPPIWIMRQAGRYMPEYRAIRAKHSFIEMCHNPQLAAEVTLLPIRTFGMDAAILFSDILVVLETLGIHFQIVEGIGPVLNKHVESIHDVEQIPPHDVNQVEYVGKAIQLLRKELKVPLIGFCGAPFTVASYLIEKERNKDLKRTKKWLMRDPKSFHELLYKIAQASISYLKMQIKAGVQAIQIFDSWAHVLGHHQFREFSLYYLNLIVKEINIPVILFCRGSSIFASQLVEIQPNGISLDWQVDIASMREKIPLSIALQGNLDPDILYGNHDTIKRETQRILSAMKKDRGFIFNLGHGIHPDIPVEAVKVMVDCVQSYS